MGTPRPIVVHTWNTVVSVVFIISDYILHRDWSNISVLLRVWSSCFRRKHISQILQNLEKVQKDKWHSRAGSAFQLYQLFSLKKEINLRFSNCLTQKHTLYANLCKYSNYITDNFEKIVILWCSVNWSFTVLKMQSMSNKTTTDRELED